MLKFLKKATKNIWKVLQIKNGKVLVEEEKLKEGAYHFINKSIAKGFVDYAGTGLDKILPPTSRRQGAREKKKQIVLEKIEKIVEVFVGI
ncbi:MAG: hypothetical protein E7D50_02810 [Finegoldia magna]|uniref:type I restriction endonuclease subunit R, EcoR124 family n=1 Tax=Finegoldia magna TaxID=1260 RepID=UPI0028FF4A29|nr:hypothetical protein [Finegoldia magna]MDU6880560.1 hypothetical protein [Finegoldia magna]